MRSPARIVLAASVTAVALIGLTACTQPAPLLTPSSSASPSASSIGLSIPRIASAATDATGAGTVTSVHDEALGTLWDVIVVAENGSEQELHMSPAGIVVAGPSSAPTSADDRSANRGRVAAASLGLASAASRMTATVSGGRLTAIALTDYQDRVVWRGDVLDRSGLRHDVVVDAVNGAVLANTADTSPTAAPSTSSTTSTSSGTASSTSPDSVLPSSSGSSSGS